MSRDELSAWQNQDEIDKVEGELAARAKDVSLEKAEPAFLG
jgi:hypothetical protein